MRPSSLVQSVGAAILLAAISAFGQNYKVESAPAPAASALPGKVSAVLQSQGARLENGQGKTVAEIWLRKSLPAQAQPDTSMDVIYGQLAPGTLVGVLHFPNADHDYRGQAVKAGYYTLRYDLVPQDGNHMGVSDYRDFLLLVPAAQDTDPQQTLRFNDVVKLSREAVSTGHPAVLLMDPANTSETNSPAVFKDNAGRWAVQLDTELEPQGGGKKSYPLAVVLVGEYQG